MKRSRTLVIKHFDHLPLTWKKKIHVHLWKSFRSSRFEAGGALFIFHLLSLPCTFSKKVWNSHVITEQYTWVSNNWINSLWAFCWRSWEGKVTPTPLTPTKKSSAKGNYPHEKILQAVVHPTSYNQTGTYYVQNSTSGSIKGGKTITILTKGYFNNGSPVHLFNDNNNKQQQKKQLLYPVRTNNKWINWLE